MPRGSIRRRSKSRPDSWTVQIYLGLHPVTGRKHYRSWTVHGTREDAERCLTELLAELDGGVLILPSGMTVGRYLDEWLRRCTVMVRPKTLVGYREQVNLYISPRIGRVQLERLTPRHVLDMEADLLARGGKGGVPLSPVTVRYAHRVLSAALAQAVKLELIPRNAAALVDAPRPTRKRIHTLSFDEARRFISLISNPKHRLLMLLALQTGLRRSELTALQWRDVDLDGGAISVRHSLSWIPGEGIIISETKSGRGRVVPLAGDSLSELRLFRSEADVGLDAFVFQGRDGGPMRPTSITQVFIQWARRAGISGLRLHDLRHTHASLMLSAGVHLKVVSERLGHSSVAITGDIYSHVMPSVQLEAVERFGVNPGSWRPWMTPRNGTTDDPLLPGP